MVNLNSQFLFQVGDKIKANNMPSPLYDERLIVGRALDVDSHNEESYLCTSQHGLTWMTAEYVHKHFAKTV